MHKVFISYHHDNDQWAKEEILDLNQEHQIFVDGSVDTGDISGELSDEAIRAKIRDEYLKDTTVTIVLVGLDTMNRKHIDWEIYSSMYDGAKNKKSGLIVVTLPSTGCINWFTSHDGEKEALYSDHKGDWFSIENRSEWEERYPYLSNRLIDNLVAAEAKISVINWDRFTRDPEGMRFLIDATYKDRVACTYDLSRDMRRANS